MPCCCWRRRECLSVCGCGCVEGQLKGADEEKEKEREKRHFETEEKEEEVEVDGSDDEEKKEEEKKKEKEKPIIHLCNVVVTAWSLACCFLPISWHLAFFLLSPPRVRISSSLSLTRAIIFPPSFPLPFFFSIFLSHLFCIHRQASLPLFLLLYIAPPVMRVTRCMILSSSGSYL